MRKSAMGPRLTIANGQTASGSIDVSGAKSMTIYTPSALTNAVIVQASPDNSNWYNHQDSGSDITLTLNDSITITVVSVPYIRLLSAGAEGATRTFRTSLR